MTVRGLCLAVVLCASCAGAEEVAAVCGASDVMRWDTRGLCGAAPTGVTAHWGGVMSASETWTKDAVHVVYGRVTLPTNVTLTVESGAVVKFVGGGIHAQGLLVAEGATFTDLADDSVGGDTDGGRDAVPYTSYAISGNVQSGVNTRFRCCDLTSGFARPGDPDVIAFDTRGLVGEAPPQTVAHAGGELLESETWAAGTVHVVYGTLVVPTNVTLTVASGAVVKFAGGGIYALGQLIADGAIFTDLADDSVGGDTDRDANGVPYTSYFIEGNVKADSSTQFRCRDLFERFVLDCGTNAFRFDTRGLHGVAPQGTVVHWGGQLEDDETWAAGATHVVYGTVAFPTNVTLTVASGAVVKFAGGGIMAGGPLVAECATFTDLDDDSLGGDTREDGWTQPFASYSIDGDVRDDAATIYRCLDTHCGYLLDGTSSALAFDTRGFDASEMDGIREHSGKVTSDETWGADETHVVYGMLSVAVGATLTIEPGAVVKFVGGGLEVEGLCIARGVTFTDLDDASRGASRSDGKLPYTSYMLEGNFETDATTVILCRGGLADGLGDAGQSRVFRMETEVDGVRFAGEPREITFSTAWDGSSAVEVTETRPDGSTVVLTNGTAECEGVFLWDAGETPGPYTLRHVTDTNELTATFYRLFNATAHDGTITGTNVWSSGVVHVISRPMSVRSGSVLFIEPGAIVKLFPGATLTVEAGGLCVAENVVFTSIHDSSVGGDTLADGGVTQPGDNDYLIVGYIRDSAATEYRHGAHSLNGTVSGDETWEANRVYVIDGTLSVAAGASLTVARGAVVKFTGGSTLAIENGATCVAEGVIFTHIADDSAGGDTMGDGSETAPEVGAYAISGPILDDETTQYRYSAPVVTSGTISQSTFWRSRNVYRVTGNLTIASGVTLTIQPGAIVKFDSGKMLTVNSGATLNANGTRAQPIVFTSIKDDAWGGDTNGDGERTEPAGGNWTGLYVNGTANLNYCIVMYAAPSNERGNIECRSGGRLTMNGCTVAHSLYDGVWNWGGTINIANSIFIDCGNAVCPYQGSTTCDNCVMFECNYGYMDWSHWVGGTFRNCIFYGMGTNWSDTNGAAEFQSHSTVRNCCFYNPEGYAKRSCTKDGVEGCLYADPGFIKPELGDFRITSESPCVDAGDGLSASGCDYYNQPRRNVATVTPTGVADAEGNYPDIGLYEVQPRFATSDIDFAMKTVIVPEAMAVGDIVEVSWRVSNLGTVNAEGPWSDKVEIISGSGEVTLLGTYLVKGGIVAGGERLVFSSFRVPSASEGECRIRVTTNYARDIYEGSQTANNVMYADVNPVVSIPTAKMSVAEAARLRLIPGQSASYALDGIPPGGGAIALSLADGVRCDALVSFGKLPTTYAHASSMTALPDGRILISIPPNAIGETVYLSLIADENVVNTDVIAELVEEYPAIYSLSKDSMPNMGSQSLEIYGVGLDSIRRIALVAPDGSEIISASARAANACELSAMFALAGAKTGAYRVAVTAENGAVFTSPSVIAVCSSEFGKPDFKVSIEAPDAIRSGRWYELAILIENTGNADGASPIISVTGRDLTFKDPDGSQTEYESVIHLLGTSEHGDPLAIGAGEIVRIPVMFKQSATASNDGMVAVNVVSREDVHWGVFINKGSMPDEEWNAFSAAYKEGFADAGAFLDAVYAKAALVASVGKPPVCAQRLYDFVQREKRGEALGVVAGVVLDDDGAVRSGQRFTIGALGSASPCVGVSADNSGMFVQYAVPTGSMVAVSEAGVISFGGDCDLGNEPLDDCVLTWHEGKDADPEEAMISHGRISRLTKLPVLPDSWLWMDGTALKGGIPGSASETTLFDEGIGSYRVCAMSESECLLVFTLPVDGTNALFASKLRITSADMQLGVGTALYITENVYSLQALSKVPDGTFRILYGETDAETGVRRFYPYVLSGEDVPDVEMPSKMSTRKTLLAAGAVDYEEDVFPSFKIGRFESPIKIGVWYEPLTDTGLKETGCCIWQQETSAKLKGGFSFDHGKSQSGRFTRTPGLSMSGKYASQDTYWCQRRTYGFGDCSAEKKTKHSSSYKLSGKATVSLEMGLSNLDGFEHGEIIPEALNLTENIFSRWGIEINASARGTLTFVRDLTRGFVTYPCDGEVVTKNVDRSTYGVRGALLVSGDVKLSGNHMFSAKNPFANLTETIGVELPSSAGVSGEIWLEYHHDWDKTGGESYHSNTASYGGKITVSPFFELSGSKQWKNGKWTGQWKRQWRLNPLGDWNEDSKYGDTSFLPWDKLDSGSSSSKNALRFGPLIKATSLMTPELAADIPVADGMALAVKSVCPCDMGSMGDSIVCREFAHDGRIWVGVFVYSEGKAVGRLNEDGENVASVKVYKSSDGLIRVFYTAALPQLVMGDEDAAFQSCIVRSLYCRTYANGMWERRIKIAGGGNTSVDDFTISQPDENGTVGLLWREDKVTGSNGSGDNTLHCATIAATRAAEAIRYGCMLDMSDGTVGAVDIRVENGLPILDYAKHLEDSDDVLHTIAYDSTSQRWVDAEVLGAHAANAVSTPMILNASGALNKSMQTANSAMRTVTVSMMKSSGWFAADGCDKKCNCGCGEYREASPPGCICTGRCKQCRQDCGSYCYCGYRHPFKRYFSFDPNEMAGPEGHGKDRCVCSGDWMNYTIYFENKAEATAAAQDIFVTLPKDPELDWTTFELGEIAFGENIDTGLYGKSKGECSYALPGTTWSVRTIVTHTDASVKWHLRVIDPSTPDGYPKDPYAGFLPPNDNTGRGEGHLRYRVKVRENATVGSVINASATIIFDTNDPITTDPAWWNTVANLSEVGMMVDGVETKLTLVSGEPFGELPAPAPREGQNFIGWFTGPNGTGVKATPDAIVPEGDFTLYEYWETLGGEVVFVDDWMCVDEGSNLTIRVRGGNADLASSVQVLATYNTAAGADLDLKGAMVNGEKPKSFKFPVTLEWAAGEIGEKTIQIPVVVDKTVEADEFLTLELANPMNVVLAGGDGGQGLTALPAGVCTVTIHDPSYDALKAKVAAGTATKAEADALAKIEKALDGKSYVRGVANDATRGKVTGSALTAAGKMVTLKATANKGYVFAGWYTLGGQGLTALPMGEPVSRLTSLVVAPSNDVDYVAWFISPEEDSLSLSEDFLPAEFTVGETVSLAVPVESVSLPTVTVSGLPAGLKYYANETIVKATAKTPGYTIPANTIYGTVTAKATTKPVTVTLTVKNLGGYQITRKYEVSVVATALVPVPFAKVVSDAAPFHAVAVSLNDDFAGKVTGAGVYQADKKVTLKATANKGYVFAGWYTFGGQDLTALPAGEPVSRSASYAFTMPPENLAYVAAFVTAAEDAASIGATVNGFAFGADSSMTKLATNVMAGVYLEWPLAAHALSETTIKVTGLPAGLKFTDKPVTSKIGSGKTSVTVTNVAANTIYGAPTAASKLDKNGYLIPSQVQVTITTAGKSKETYLIDLTVDPLPAWSVGTFNGLSHTGDRLGSATMTVAATGKISGKILVSGTNVAFTAANFEASSKTLGETQLVAQVEGKLGKETLTGMLTLTQAGAFISMGETTAELTRAVWKDKGASPVPTEVQGLYTIKLLTSDNRGTGYLSLTVGKDGSIKVAGKTPEGVALTGSATLNIANEANTYFADLFIAPSSYKGGYVAGRLTWRADRSVSGELEWVNLDPQATSNYGESFTRQFRSQGAWYAKADALKDYYSPLSFVAPNGVGAANQTHWNDLTLSLDATGKKFIVDQKVTKPLQDKTTKAWSYDGENDAALAFSFTEATGIWKGSFLWWFDEPKHASTKVPFEGILVPGENLEGAGSYSVPASYIPLDKNGKPQKEKTYQVKESVPVEFRLNEE